MDQHKPLSYESLKTVIQYMDANFRIVGSCQIASLRKIQKVVPLKLGVLEMNDLILTFDNIGYKYYHCLKFIERDGCVITCHSQYDINDDGGSEIFEDLMPGDIVIKYKNWIDCPLANQHLISDSYVECEVRTGLNDPYRSCQPHYGMKVRDIMRTMLHKVLGGKRIHQVECLKIGVYHGVLRLPEGLKLQIRELSIKDNSMAVIDAILPILDVSSFPLKRLSIRLGNVKDPVIQSEILRTCEFLNIENWGIFDNGSANLLINLPNIKIHLTNEIPSNDIVLIIRNWMEHSRVIGTRISMQAVSVEEYLDEIEKEFNVVERVLSGRECTIPFSCLTLPMTSTSELNIYEAKSPNYEKELKKERLRRPYMVVMEVMPIGTSKPLKLQ